MKLVVDNIKKSYKKTQVLKGVSFEADGGECVGIIGSNGAGKTTLLSCIARLYSSVAYVPQINPLMVELTGRDNLKLWYDRESLKASLENGILKKLSVEAFLDKRVCEMSGGMKKRLSIGCALCSDADIILLDEPTEGLDSTSKKDLYSILDELKHDGKVIIIATHIPEEIRFCDRILLLSEGKLNPYEDVDELL